VRWILLSILIIMLSVGAGLFFLLRSVPDKSTFVFERRTAESSTAEPTPPTPAPTPTPVPTPTPTPDPYQRYRELEETFFPILSQLRQIPGNENARVDWEFKHPRSGTVDGPSSGKAAFVNYIVYGLTRIPIDLLIPNIRDPRYRPEAGVYIQQGWAIRPNGGGYGFFLPDARNSFWCSQTGQTSSRCALEGDTILVLEPQKGLVLAFTVYDNGEWFNVPRAEVIPPTRGGGK
jgi:hypothetical protein